jgi:glutamate-5-semialdehyde dehydrogenase
MMATAISELEVIGRNARAAARRLALLSTEAKNKALLAIADALEARWEEIVAANEQDITASRAAGLPEAMIDRLVLTQSSLKQIAADVRHIASLPDPVGEEFDGRTLPNGLRITRRRVPLGVIASIYESRPNVTVDIASLALKSGNACILRGGKEAIYSNTALARIIQTTAAGAGVPEGAVQFVENTDRALVGELLQMKQYIDLMVPRGGEGLVKRVLAEATMPVVAAGDAVVHTYIDEFADVEKAVTVAVNAKCRRTSICNALDGLLVHQSVASAFLPRLASEWAKHGVQIRGDEATLTVLSDVPTSSEWDLRPASESDWGHEFLDSIAAVKIVESMDDAIEHIERYGSAHSEAIITESYTNAMRFLNEVDAAAVYVNASTQFTDGGQFGLGAEIGISNQKIHARGPMGLRELTSYKWVVLGNGHTRP